MIKFAAFILTHGRPENVITYRNLRRCGYTGPIYLIVDDLDKTKEKYVEIYGNEVILFDKKEAAKITDQGDNTTDLRSVVYARNESFRIAKRLGLTHFIQLDDDYVQFEFRFTSDLTYHPKPCKKLDDVFAAMVEFLEETKATTVTMAQGGDFIGGAESRFAEAIMLKRKAMNSFVCSVERPFKFFCKMNDDVTTYTYGGFQGGKFFYVNQVSLKQKQTQQNSGGMTDIYLDQGTYVKSFFSVMFQPSSIKVEYHPVMRRIHHRIDWEKTVPLILSETLKKGKK